MEKVVKNVGVLVLFYGVIVLGIILLNMRFRSMNVSGEILNNQNYLAMND